MNVALAVSPPSGTTEQISLHRFTVAEYQRMGEAGALEGLRVELLDGWISDKKMHNPPHDFTVARLHKHLLRLLSEDWTVRSQSSVVTKDSQPEPDLVVARGSDQIYAARHPGPKDTVLLVEVSDATLSFDRSFKGSLYARARIPVYWIVNLVNRGVEVYTEPKTGRSPSYRTRRDYTEGESVPLVLDGQEIARILVRDLLP